jgi:hypothetical protein
MSQRVSTAQMTSIQLANATFLKTRVDAQRTYAIFMTAVNDATEAKRVSDEAEEKALAAMDGGFIDSIQAWRFAMVMVKMTSCEVSSAHLRGIENRHAFEKSAKAFSALQKTMQDRDDLQAEMALECAEEVSARCGF